MSGSDSQDLAIEITRNGKILSRVRLEPKGTYIGRMAENQIALDDPEVSRSHAFLSFKAGSWILEDQHSENGVLLNGRKTVKSPVKLGDVLRVGPFDLKLLVDPTARKIDVSTQLQEADQPSRSEHTVMMQVPEYLQKSVEQSAKKSAALPKLGYHLHAFGKNFEGQITFEQGKRLDTPTAEPILELRLSYGPYVLYKKIPLES